MFERTHTQIMNAVAGVLASAASLQPVCCRVASCACMCLQLMCGMWCGCACIRSSVLAMEEWIKWLQPFYKMTEGDTTWIEKARSGKVGPAATHFA